MIKRQLINQLQNLQRRPQAIHLMGMRQVGKTTLMESFRETLAPTLDYKLQDLVTLRTYEHTPQQWVLEIENQLKKNKGRVLHVFVDEIQKIPDFFQGIQGLYDQHKGKIKFWIWGSSARPLKRKRAETLAGRSLLRTLWPLSQSECLNQPSVVPHLFDIETLEKELQLEEPRDYLSFFQHAIRSTLLPEPFLLKELSATHDLLSSYQASYLENEIRRENLVDDIGLFERFLMLAAGRNTEILHDTEKAKILGVHHRTVHNYYGILEDTFVCRKIPAYGAGFKMQISKSPKVYFSDTGLARFVAGERGIPAEDTSAFGKIFEGFVVDEILKQIDYHQLGWKPSYFRTKTGLEVDLILTQGTHSVAIEIKSSRKISQGDTLSLQKLMKMDQTIQRGFVVSRQPTFQINDRTWNIPVWNL